jgi:hypothetical protein
VQIIGAENSILGYLPASGSILQIEPHLVIHGVMMEFLRQASAGFVSSSNLPSNLFLFLLVTVRLQRSFFGFHFASEVSVSFTVLEWVIDFVLGILYNHL